MIDDGLSEQEATRRFWCVDKQGLLLDDMSDLRDFQQPYALPHDEVSGWGSTDLAGVIANVHATQPSPIARRSRPCPSCSCWSGALET